MKTLFKKMLEGAFVAALFFSVNINVKGQTWNIPTNANAITPNTSYFGMTTDNHLIIQNNSASNHILFKTNSTNIERMRITSSGLVGIGDFSSSSLFAPFQVGSNQKKISIGDLSNDQTYGGNRGYIGFNAAYDGANWNIYNDDHDGDQGGAVITTWADGTLAIYGATVGQQNMNSTLTNSQFFSSTSCLFYVSPLYGAVIPGNYGLRVGASVSIGNSTFTEMPSGYKLYVEDGILTEKLKVALIGTSNWSDFVFDKSYKLLPLTEVEKFIDENKHLPDIPCAEEVVKNGIDVAVMDAKLLQKIEELTLYMIKINKNMAEMTQQIEQLKKENEELKNKVSE